MTKIISSLHKDFYYSTDLNINQRKHESYLAAHRTRDEVRKSVKIWVDHFSRGGVQEKREIAENRILKFLKEYKKYQKDENPTFTGELNLSGLNLSSLPTELHKLHGLVSLNLSGNNLKRIPDSVLLMPNLKKLNLNHNKISTHDQNLNDLCSLEELNLDNNQIKIFPKEILTIHSLEKLTLEHNQIEIIPRNIAKLSKLKELFFGNNSIRIIPETIDLLEDLQSFIIPENQINSLPDQIKNLSILDTLDIRNNNFSVFPIQAFSIKNLCILYCAGNNFKRIPADLLNQAKFLAFLDWAQIQPDNPKLQERKENLEILENIMEEKIRQKEDYSTENKKYIDSLINTLGDDNNLISPPTSPRTLPSATPKAASTPPSPSVQSGSHFNSPRETAGANNARFNSFDEEEKVEEEDFDPLLHATPANDTNLRNTLPPEQDTVIRPYTSGRSNTSFLPPIINSNYQNQFTNNIQSDLNQSDSSQHYSPQEKENLQELINNSSETLSWISWLSEHIDCSKQLAQSRPFPAEYEGNQAARDYYNTMHDALYTAVSYLAMNSVGRGFSDSMLSAALSAGGALRPALAAAHVASTVTIVIPLICTALSFVTKHSHQTHETNKAIFILNCLPNAHGPSLTSFIHELTACLVHLHVQRSQSPELDELLSALELGAMKACAPAEDNPTGRVKTTFKVPLKKSGETIANIAKGIWKGIKKNR